MLSVGIELKGDNIKAEWYLIPRDSFDVRHRSTNSRPGSLTVPEMMQMDGPGFSLCATPLELSGPGFQGVW